MGEKKAVCCGMCENGSIQEYVDAMLAKIVGLAQQYYVHGVS